MWGAAQQLLTDEAMLRMCLLDSARPAHGTRSKRSTAQGPSAPPQSTSPQTHRFHANLFAISFSPPGVG